MGRSSLPARFLTEAERRTIVEAIKEAEAKTSGEIRVHLDRKSKGDAQAAAKKVFEKIGMDRTAEKNGVLIVRIALFGSSGLGGRSYRRGWGSSSWGGSSRSSWGGGSRSSGGGGFSGRGASGRW